MKWLFFVFSIMSLNATAQHFKTAIVEVLADSAEGQTVSLTQYCGPALDYKPIVSKSANGKTVRFSIYPDSSSEYGLQLHSDVETRILLAKGDSLVYHYSPASGFKLRYDRIGATQILKDSLKAWTQDKNYYHNLDTLSWADWNRYVSGIRERTRQVAERVQMQYPEHRSLSEILKAESTFRYFVGRLTYVEENYWDSTGKPLVNDTARFHIIDSIPWQESIFLKHPEEAYLVSTYTTFIDTRKYYERDTINQVEKRFEIARALPRPANQAAWVDGARRASWGDPKVVEPIMANELKEHGKEMDTAYVALFEKMLMKVRAKLPGNMAPPFSLPDSTHRVVSLSDFRGKTIYLDFWGSWCPPCRKEIPSLSELEHKFEGDTNLAFVSISLEYKEWDFWKNYVREHNMKGAQLYAEKQFGNEAAQAYAIQIVPTYMIIGADGTFIDADAPRPSSGKAEEAIRAAMTKRAN